MTQGSKKAERLREMERLYFQRAYSDIELADRFGVDRTTIYRDRRELAKEVAIVQDADGRHHVDRGRYISNIRVNLPEALSLYLAARRMSQQTRFAQTPVASGLEKLALVLRQPMTERLVKAADRILNQQTNPRQAEIFETVARAWIDGLALRITYRPLERNQTTKHLFSPYLLEPSPWSDAIYLIGQSDRMPGIATLKLDRIERASLSGAFSVPDDFDDELLLQHAWGIWGGTRTPENVVLRFSGNRAVRRLRESIWHPLENIEETDDGSCTWSAPIANWQEMLPWIRGWGADVEVLAPPELREVQVVEASRLADLYQVKSTPPDHMLFWAKTGSDGRTHPLLCHLIDVGQVALALWENVLTDAFRNQMAVALGLQPEEAGRLLAFWAACHDMGKASPNFQRKYEPARPELEQAGFAFPPLMGKTVCYHATISALLLPELLVDETGLDEESAREVAQALGGHQGSWPTTDVRRSHRGQLGDANWQPAQRALLRNLVDLFAPPTVTRLGARMKRSGLRCSCCSPA